MSPAICANRIRPLAICVFYRDRRILVNEAHDPLTGQTFYRPLGGGIEFGETSVKAIAREIREEIGAEVTQLRLLGTLESLFTFSGVAGHEIVQVYDGESQTKHRCRCTQTVCWRSFSNRLQRKPPKNSE